jgi:hypothetical protein
VILMRRGGKRKKTMAELEEWMDYSFDFDKGKPQNIVRVIPGNKMKMSREDYEHNLRVRALCEIEKVLTKYRKKLERHLYLKERGLLEKWWRLEEYESWVQHVIKTHLERKHRLEEELGWKSIEDFGREEENND